LTFDLALLDLSFHLRDLRIVSQRSSTQAQITQTMRDFEGGNPERSTMNVERMNQ